MDGLSVHVRAPPRPYSESRGQLRRPRRHPIWRHVYDFGVATPSAILAHIRAHARFQTARGVMSIGSFSSPELHVCRNIQAKTARTI